MTELLLLGKAYWKPDLELIQDDEVEVEDPFLDDKSTADEDGDEDDEFGDMDEDVDDAGNANKGHFSIGEEENEF